MTKRLKTRLMSSALGLLLVMLSAVGCGTLTGAAVGGAAGAGVGAATESNVGRSAAIGAGVGGALGAAYDVYGYRRHNDRYDD
jgi:hypothetical protein